MAISNMAGGSLINEGKFRNSFSEKSLGEVACVFP